MADLRIVDAPLLSTVKGTEKIPTGGEGNFSVSVNQVADFAKLKWVLATEGYVDNAVGNVQADLNLHKNNVSNPHQVTKEQVGLGNVDNTADLDKPVSNATQSAIITANSGKADKTYVDNSLPHNNLIDRNSSGAHEAVAILNKSGENQQEINDRGGANWYAKSGGYNLNDRVILDNGDVVKSTITNNIANPNIDMTNWIKTSLITINSVSEFIKIKPHSGLTVVLTKYDLSVTTGGGIFECKSGVFTADGGHIFASSESGYYFERLSNDVNLFDYGIKIQDVATTRSVGAVDYYQKLVAAINRAKSTSKPLVSPFPMFNDEFTIGSRGVYISQGIDISGLKILQGSLTLFIKGSVFTPIVDLGTNTNWVLLNKNARYDVDGKQYNSSTQGRQSIESISIVNVNERTTVPNLHGQLHTTAHSNIKGTLSSYKMGARGVWLASTYDSSFVDVKVNQCGNLDFFAYDTAGYAPFVDTLDETNAITVSNLMVHDSYDRAMNLRGAKNTYVRIHEEKTIVTTNRGGVPDYYSPYGYYNSFVNLVGGAIVEWQSDAKNVAEHLYPVVNVVVMADTDVGTLYTHEHLIVHTTNNPPNTFGGDIGTINCNELYVVANAKASIGNCRVTAKTMTGKYAFAGNVTILDTTSSIDILQYEGVATTSGGVLTKVTGGNLTANNCGIVKANVAALVVTGSDSSIGTVNATSLNINAGHIGHATISANATVSGGEISKLICATLTHTGGVISSGSSSGNITSTGGAVNNFASQGAAALGGEGNYTRVTLDNAANAVLTLTGAPVLRSCATASNAVVSAGTGLPAKMDRCFVAGSLSMNDNSNLAVKDSRVDGQLNLGGASIKFSSINTPFGNLSTFGTGYWTFINCKFSATAGNWIFGNDITNPLGFMTQHPVTKELFICTATGWKQITHA